MSDYPLPVQVIVFDVDGTLLDSVDLHAKAWVDAFADYGHRLQLEDIRGQIGKGGDQLLPAFLTPEEIASRGEELEAHRAKLLKQRYLPLMKPFPKVRELLERVRNDGKKVALASSAKKDELEIYKEILNVEDLIDIETSSDDAEKSKPHADIFQAVLKRLGNAKPGNLLAVGDTAYDAQAAEQAGIRIVGLLSGGWSEKELRKAGCFAVYRDPADLLVRYPEWSDS